MKKNGKWRCFTPFITKIVRVMKICMFLILLCSLQLSANVMLGQQVSLNAGDISVREVFKELKKQTGTYFMYSEEVVAKDLTVNVDLNNVSLEEALNDVCDRANLQFQIVEDYVLIKKKAPVVEQPVQQQKKQLKGTVTDEAGIPLPGVSVVVKGTNTGVATNIDGEYYIEFDVEDAVIMFSFIGYVGEEIQVAGKTLIDIQLKADIAGLDEVVVVGYGSQRKVTLTGAVSTINAKEITTTTNENVVNMLAGKVAGVRILQRSGEPGSFDSEIDIRGMGTPLVVIDGVASDVDALNRLNANDISDVSVLKDASAAAVYGVRAANGVILVKTKRGGTGKTAFNYKSTYGMQVPMNFLKPMNTVDYLNTQNLYNMIKNVGKGDPKYSAAEIQSYIDDPSLGSDWYDVAFKDAAPQMQHSLSASGGTEKVSYYMSLGYMEQDGFYRSGDLNYNKLTLRSNLTAQLTDNLQAELLISRMSDDKEAPYMDSDDIVRETYKQRPNAPTYANGNPEYLNGQGLNDAYHTLAITNRGISGYNDTQNQHTVATLALNYTVPFVDGLKARVMHTRDYRSTFGQAMEKNYSLYGYDETSDSYNEISAGINTNLTNTFSERKYQVSQFSLNYEKIFAEDHSFKLLALYEETETIGTNFYAKSFMDVPIDQLYSGNKENQVAGSYLEGDYVDANKGLVGRLNYNYASKYMAELSFRYDGSSKFSQGEQWGFFPAASVGWVISDENFFKSVDALSFVNSFKIRASYGELGSDETSDFQYLGGYDYPNTDDDVYGSIIGGAYLPSLGFRTAPNTNLTWITTKTTNIGFDSRLFDGKLSIEGDYFIRTREGLLNSVSSVLPNTYGVEFSQANLDSDQTKGFEVVIRHKNRVGDFSYYVNANMSYTRTKNVSSVNTEFVDSYDKWRNGTDGRYSNILWGQLTEGTYTSREDMFAADVHAWDRWVVKHALPGSPILTDWNGDGFITHPGNYTIDNYDMVPIGTGLLNDGGRDTEVSKPLLNFGLTLGGSWKGFDIDMLFQGAFFNTIQNNNQDFVNRLQGGDNNSLAHLADTWAPADINDMYGEWVAGTYPAFESWIHSTYADTFLRNGKFLRLKSMEIGYTLPSSIVEKHGIESFRVFVSGYNIFTWDNLIFDPERRGNSEYMNVSSYNVGVNVQF